VFFQRPGSTGRIAFDIAEPTLSKTKSKKEALLVVPGVTGDCDSPYVYDMVREAVGKGYTVIVLNSTVPYGTKEQDLEVIDFTDSKAYDDILAEIKRLVGDDVDLYALGFSLGANTLLRYLGDCGLKGKDPQIRAAVCISPPFDLLATGISLQWTALGMIDWFLLG
jgi:predicted alpha/beta-fold hydrolase